MYEFGVLKQIDPNEIWKNEERDFTPWLAENINLLSKSLGISLKVEQVEAKVGDFELDIQAQDEDDGSTVIIENQLGETDHKHLGQLMTYAAGSGAKTVVWIVRKSRDEHRAVIEWLNKIANSEVVFFLVQIEVFRIDASLPVVKFVVEVSPSEFERTFDEIKERGSSLSPVRIIWGDSPEPIRVSTWKEIFRRTLEKVAQENVDFQQLPVKCTKDKKEAENNFNAPMQIGEQNLYVEGNLSSNAIRQKVSNILKQLGKQPKFLRIECNNETVYELPQ